MSMLREMRRALAAAASVDGLQMKPYMLAMPDPPTGHVYPTPVDYDKAFQRGHDIWTFTVQVFTGLVDDVGAQEQLDDFLEPVGPKSMKEALERDVTLGLDFVFDVTVKRAEGYRPYRRDDGVLLLGCTWIVEVQASGQ